MFFIALATDYDGTLAQRGRVDAATLDALREVKASGRKLLLVTGRELADLVRVFDGLDLFDLVVAENGALLYDPQTKNEIVLAEPPPAAFVERLKQRGVAPLSVGRAIVATWEPHESTVLEAVRDLGLELHIIFNKGAVMVLPSNVNKASGLKAALKRLGLSAHNVVGIGDAENDQAFLNACGCAVAVDNALPSVKANVDFVVADHGRGVIELARMLTDTDLAHTNVQVARQQPVLGTKADGSLKRLTPYETVLITGSSGGGKSTIVTALLEQMREGAFQFCIVDPEGDYAEFPGAVVVGDANQEPRPAEIKKLLAEPDVNVIVNLLAIDAAERPRFLATFLPEISMLRGETGRPHWLVLDEAHHCLPAKWDPAPIALPRELPATIAVTVHPDEVSPAFLELVSTVVGIGEGGGRRIEEFCTAAGRTCDLSRAGDLEQGRIHVLDGEDNIETLAASQPKERQKRHARKYAEGQLGEDKSFYFRGPDAALNLRAHNLSAFLQLAGGVDDKTWLHHLRGREYSTWFRDAIKDDDMAAEAAVVEHDGDLSAQDSRERIKELVERRYTAPAKEA